MTTLKVFVVEDSPVIRQNLTEALEEMAPVQVVGFADNEQGAITWLCDGGNLYDLIIVDIFLRRGSGLGVLAASPRFTKPFAMIVLSNFATADIRKRCLELGADVVFDKSEELEELLSYCNGLADAPTGPGHLAD